MTSILRDRYIKRDCTLYELDSYERLRRGMHCCDGDFESPMAIFKSFIGQNDEVIAPEGAVDEIALA